MKAGVSTAPCAVVITPRRAPPSLCVTRKPNGVVDNTTDYNLIRGAESTAVLRVLCVHSAFGLARRSIEKAPRRRDLRRPLPRARSLARVGGRGFLKPPSAALPTHRH